MAVKTEIITSWEKLAEFAAAGAFGDTALAYRGVGSSGYQLIPRVGRQGCFSTGFSVEKERLTFIEFKRKAFAFLPPGVPENMNDGDWLFLAQHHGLPTRLLDWSESMLVAAFFAVDGDEEDDAALYLWPQSIDADVVIENPFEADEPISFVAPSHISARLSAQQSMFTLHANPTDPWVPDSLIKYLIPQNLRFPIKAALDQVGFNRATLFPDLEGLAENLRWNDAADFSAHRED